jgi:SPP1 gp7 family putative phage head morphogenesis protein
MNKLKLYDKDGGGGGSSIRDAYLRHFHYVDRLGVNEGRRLITILDTANEQVKKLIIKAKTVETKRQLARVLSEIRQISKDLSEHLYGQMKIDFEEFAETETDFIVKSLQSIGIQTDLTHISPQKLFTAASFASYVGYGKTQNYSEYLDGISTGFFERWSNAVKAGYLTGQPAAAINRQVLGSMKNMEPGEMKSLRNSLNMNSRTMLASMANETHRAIYRQNEGLFGGYRYLGVLDSRQCLVCGNLDGHIYKTLDDTPKLPQHARCRCLILPMVKGMPDYIEGDERASVNGPVDSRLSYGEWLKTQDDEFVLDALGPSRFKMWKNGTPITSFVENTTILTLKELKDRGI